MKKAENGRKRPILADERADTPLKPPFVTPPSTAAQTKVETKKSQI